MLHCAMGLPATRKTAIEEDRGEDNKDPDWLSEQSIARQVAREGEGGGGRGSYTAQLCNNAATKKFEASCCLGVLHLRDKVHEKQRRLWNTIL